MAPRPAGAGGAGGAGWGPRVSWGAEGPSRLPPWTSPDQSPDRPPWSQVARTVAALVLLPLLGALVAYRLTAPPGPGPLGFVQVAEAPPAEVAGARAVDDPLGLGELAALRARAGATTGDPALQTRTALAPLAAAGGALQTPDGILIRVPVGAVTGAWPAGLATAPRATGTSAVPVVPVVPAIPAGSEGVLGATDAITGGEGPPGARDTGAGSAGSSTGQLVYRALEPGPADRPGPRILKLFAVGALAPDGLPLERFASPLTLTVPYTPDAITGWVALASYDPASDGWIELPVRATSPRRAIISAQLPQPAIVALLENRPPLTAPDVAEAEVDVAITLDVLANDTDPDGDELAVFERTTRSAAGGDVRCSHSGTCTYIPPPGFAGEDSFTYGLGDLRTQAWSDNTAEGTVTVLVGATPGR